jgi:hypothetical protein
MTEATVKPDRWAIVAIMGHQERTGRVSEEMVAGAPMLRVDIPLPDGTFSTRHLGAASIYEITYVSEDVARAVAAVRPAHPIQQWTAQHLGLLPQRPALVEAGDDEPIGERDEP